MTTPHKERCRSCGALIYWATTDKGRSMPIDATPCPEGNVLLTRRGEALKARVLAAGEEVEPGRNRWVSHYATCEQADQWRRR